MSKKITKYKALTILLGNLKQPVVTSYQLSLLLHHLYIEKKFKGQEIRITKQYAARSEYNDAIKHLTNEGILLSNKNFPQKSVFKIIGKSDSSPEEIVCSVDPFSYFSHLSAMDFHGLTDRIPKTLFISSPSPSDWKKYAISKMEKDCGDTLPIFVENNLPKLTRIKFEKIGKRNIHRHSSTHLGAYKNVKDRMLRVATIGRTFLDMLREPDLCGGISHVINVFDKHALQYLRLITDEIENNGKDIDKVRAGYLLDERLGITDATVSSWSNFAQRGGSRKLDAKAEYSPNFSERWCLSLNVVDL